MRKSRSDETRPNSYCDWVQTAKPLVTPTCDHQLAIKEGSSFLTVLGLVTKYADCLITSKLLSFISGVIQVFHSISEEIRRSNITAKR